jgi:hypothetical protein
MSADLEQEILEAIRSGASRPRPLLDPAEGKAWLGRLADCLKEYPIEDITDYRYRYAGAYCFQVGLPFTGEGNWVYHIRVRVSGLGPYVSHAVYRQSLTDAHWGGPCHMVKDGYTEEQKSVLAALRQWCGALGLKEPDEPIRALPVPGVTFPGHAEEMNVFRALFRP